jgi:periplasmic divalent cation tolerance protein
MLPLKLKVDFKYDSILLPAYNSRHKMTDKKLVLTTCGSQEEAIALAKALVERQLAACVNIFPQVESVYRWQGKVESAAEYLLLIKTTAGAFDRLRVALHELHSYNIPECIEVAVEGGSEAYLQWIGESVR